jgi:phosphohistidine swiveling domain-containing protein
MTRMTRLGGAVPEDPVRRRVAKALVDMDQGPRPRPGEPALRAHAHLRLHAARLPCPRTGIRGTGAAGRITRRIFFLTKDEVLGAVEGYGLSPDLKSLVALRKAEHDAAAKRPDPPERIELRGPAIAPVWTEQAVERDTAMSRTGTGCSAGKVTAKARVIRDPRTEALAPGDILIARHTDPGWIAVFSNASAIVVERGSLLSHSAIVARELGIPCVVGLKGATKWIADGETISVDGATGLVERHDAKL